MENITSKHPLSTRKRFILSSDYPGNSQYWEGHVYSSEFLMDSEIEFLEKYPANFKKLNWFELLTVEELCSIKEVILTQQVVRDAYKYDKGIIFTVHSLDLHLRECSEVGSRFMFNVFENDKLAVHPNKCLPHA